MGPELLIMNWVFTDPPSHTAGHAQQQSVINWSSLSSLEGTSESHEEFAQMSMVPASAVLPSAFQHAPTASGGAPYDRLTEKEKTRAWFTGGSIHDAGTTQQWTAAALSGTALKDSREGKSAQWADLQAVHMLVYLT